MALAANFRGKAAGTRPPEDQSQGFRHGRTENTGNGTEQEFSSSYEHLEGDTTGVVDPDVSFEAYF